MSKDLTEQWKKKTLYGGWYFLEFENGSILPVYYCGFNREFEFRWDWKISKVLAPASYDHFVELTEKANQFSQMVKKVDELVTKCHRLEKQLDIATKALRDYANESSWVDCKTVDDDFEYTEKKCAWYTYGYETAQKVLKEIDEVLK